MLIVHHPDGIHRHEDNSHGRLLSAVLRDLGLALNTRCNQRGLCNGCFVELVSGKLVSGKSAAETPGHAEPAIEPGQLLRACQFRLIEGQTAEIRIPPRSLLAHQPQVVTSFSLEVTRAHDPLWQTMVVGQDELDRSCPLPEAICQAVNRQREADLPVRTAASTDAWDLATGEAIAVTLEHRGDHWELASGNSQMTSSPRYGVAIDVGTTTVVVLLVDLADGRIVASASDLNAQTRLGDNVLTRINMCMTDPSKVRRLQNAVARRTLNPLLDQVTGEANVERPEIATLVVAGNTTMLHLLAGVDPTPMGMAPFTPRFLDHRVLGCDQVRLGDTTTPVHFLPGAAAYVGADIMAGVLSSGMVYRQETCLLVDVGTNGEIVLKHEDRLLACATAAGPAFEGSGLTCGMRAGRGAISHVALETPCIEPRLEVIGDVPPVGLCGTAYVDFVAQARRVGLIGATGRFTELADDHPRVEAGEYARQFRLANDADGESIHVSEGDIASLLQAKAAIAAGILCLLAEVQATPADVATLYLAGGFGFHMDVDNVLRCGLLPGFESQQIHMVGNTSLAGAYLALLDSSALAEIKRISEAVETVELNLDPTFEMQYIDQLSLEAC